MLESNAEQPEIRAVVVGPRAAVATGLRPLGDQGVGAGRCTRPVPRPRS